MPEPIPQNHNVRGYHPPRLRYTPVPPARPRPPYTPVPPPAPARRIRARPRVPVSLRRDPWEHRVAALVVGTGLYGVVDYYSDSLFTKSTNLVNHLWGSVQLGSHTYMLMTGSILIALLFAVPLFFGAAFGPWVGLLVGAVGGLTGDYVAAHAFGFAFDWRWGVGMGIIGFFASIAPFRTRQRYTILATTLIAFIVGALAIAIGIGGAAFSINWSLSTTFATNLFIEFAPDALVAVLFFSFLLFVYNAIVSRR